MVSSSAYEHASSLQDLPPVPEQSTTRGRITIYCIAESLNRKELEKRLRDSGSKCLVQAYPDVCAAVAAVVRVSIE